jgi:hypothetical protein
MRARIARSTWFFAFGPLPIAVALALAGLGCASARAPLGESRAEAPAAAGSSEAHDPLELREFTAQRAFPATGPVGCGELVNAYCAALYSPRAAGNLRVPQSEAPATILQGETRNNFPAVFVAYAKAKLKRQGRLPYDFQAALARRSYFPRIKQLLMRKPRAAMTVQDRVEDDQLEKSLASDWSSAFDEATLKRMRKKFPQFHSLSELEIPIEWQIERRRVRRALISEVATALWTGDPNWRKVERGFASLRDSFIELIDEIDAPEALRAAWRARIMGIELVLPGSRPAIADEDCSSTKNNA